MLSTTSVENLLNPEHAGELLEKKVTYSQENLIFLLYIYFLHPLQNAYANLRMLFDYF